MKKLLLLLFLVILTPNVHADQEGIASSFLVESADKKHTFVVINPSLKNEILDGKYSVSGMYRNDGSISPLWTIDWNSRIYLPNGGEYVVRRGKWARYSATYREEALSFVAHGNVLKIYSTADLITFPWLLSHSVSHYRWETFSCYESGPETGAIIKISGNTYPANNGVDFSDENQTMQMASQLGDHFTFDLKTGEIVSAARPARNICLWLVAALLIAYFIYRVRTFRKSGKALVSIISSLVVGGVFSVCLLLFPAAAVYFTQIPDACGPTEAASTLYMDLWMSFHLFPAYCLKFFSETTPDSLTVISVSSLEAFMPAAGFWIVCVAAFALLDRSVVTIMRKIALRSVD